jgi:hypothetical protein
MIGIKIFVKNRNIVVSTLMRIRTRRSGIRIPSGKEIFSSPKVRTVLRAHLAPHPTGTEVFPGAKRPGREVDN